MTIDLIPANASRESRAMEAFITHIIARDESPIEFAAALYASVV